MPGFVDVSGWSDQDVKRLGQIDDDDFDSNSGFRGRGRATNRRVQSPSVTYSVSDVWAAACAAQRINGEYVKEEQWMRNATPPYIAKRRSRDVMMDFLRGVETLTDEDREAGKQCREFLNSDLTFRALQNKTTSFDDAVRKVLAVDQRFDTALNRYELAIVACLPASVDRSQTRQTVNERVQFARGGYIGNLGNKVVLKDVEVISANYSQQYNIFWIRGVTDQDQVVLFSNKEKFDVGSHLSIQGKVKAHRDNLTQLNYVKVL